MRASERGWSPRSLRHIVRPLSKGRRVFEFGVSGSRARDRSIAANLCFCPRLTFGPIRSALPGHEREEFSGQSINLTGARDMASLPCLGPAYERAFPKDGRHLTIRNPSSLSPPSLEQGRRGRKRRKGGGCEDVEDARGKKSWESGVATSRVRHGNSLAFGACTHVVIATLADVGRPRLQIWGSVSLEWGIHRVRQRQLHIGWSLPTPVKGTTS
jgi:hypothetical protein